MCDKVKFRIIELLKSIGSACKDERCLSWSKVLKEGEKSATEIPHYYEPNMSAVISSTSGSTGKPKRPVMSNESLNAVPVLMGMSCDTFAPNDSILTTLPIWILYSLFNSIHEPLCLGVTVDLDPLFDSKKVFKRMKQYRFNHWNTIPSYVEDMVDRNENKNKRLDLSFLKSITTGGDFRPPKLKIRAEELLKKHNSMIEIGQGYGATECGGCFGYTYEKEMNPSSIGKPLVGNSYKIVDIDTGEKLGVNQSGQLFFYSPTLMSCYYHDDEATEKALTVDENGTVWYKTGDIVHYDEKGQMFMDGRLRRVEISRDSNGIPTKVFPDKVKQIISKHPSVEQCEVIMIPDEKRITRPVAYIVMKENCFFDQSIQSEINDLCVLEGLEGYLIPTEFIPIQTIPLTSGLKVDFNRLSELYYGSNEGVLSPFQKAKRMKNV